MNPTVVAAKGEYEANNRGGVVSPLWYYKGLVHITERDGFGFHDAGCTHRYHKRLLVCYMIRLEKSRTTRESLLIQEHVIHYIICLTDKTHGCLRVLRSITTGVNGDFYSRKNWTSAQCARQQPYVPFITGKLVRFPRNKVHLTDKTAVYTTLAGALALTLNSSITWASPCHLGTTSNSIAFYSRKGLSRGGGGSGTNSTRFPEQRSVGKCHCTSELE